MGGTEPTQPDWSTRPAVVVVDRTGVIQGWSPEADAMFGFGKDDVVGRSLGETVMKPWLAEELSRALERIASGSLEPLSQGPVTVPVRDAAGRDFTVEVSAQPCELRGESLAVFHVRKPGTDSTRTSDVLEVLFERAPEIITIFGDDGSQRTINASGLKILGWDENFRRPPDSMVFVHPDDRAKVLGFWAAGPHAGATDEVDYTPLRYRARAADGSWRWLETLVADLTDVPEVAGYVAFSRDVTEAEGRAQALLESEARLTALIASFPGGAFLDDPDAHVLLANETLAKYFGIPVRPQEVAGTATADLIAAIGETLVDPSDLLALAGADELHATAKAELDLLDGRAVDVEMIPVQDGAVLGRLWLFHDATGRREAERRQRALLGLEKIAREQAEVQAEQLTAYDNLRNEFVSTMSHELRTPLTSIASASELLLAEFAEVDPALEASLQIIRRNADQLRHIVEDLLLVGRLKAGMLALEAEPVVLTSLLADVALVVEPMARQRDVSVAVDAPAGSTVPADPRRLARVVENLVSNAVKFTEPGTTVELSAERGVGCWKVAVRDHGPGVPPDQREAVFDRFVRTREADREGTPGSGLGLAIVKGLVELHGGSVTVGDAEGGGAVFVCTLPSEEA